MHIMSSLSPAYHSQGTTSLFAAGRRVRKTHEIINCLGDNDELGCALGVALEHLRISAHPLAPLPDQIVAIQSALQELNSHIATPPDRRSTTTTTFDPQGEWLPRLESWIDALDAELSPLRQFILPVRRNARIPFLIIAASRGEWKVLTCTWPEQSVDEPNAPSIE